LGFSKIETCDWSALADTDVITADIAAKIIVLVSFL
jgi:hypothetical protein